jgi:tetratricopeptide (TPR) repeat protein
MRIHTSSAALALLAAAPAIAQSPSTAGAQGQAAVQLKPSAKARPAIVALQTAVNANDVANIPALVAAAQAVASNKDDRYLIGQLQLKAALAANNMAGAAAAIDAVAASGYLDAGRVAELHTSLGAKFYEQKQFAQAAAQFERAVALTPSDLQRQLLVADARMSEGRKGDAAAIYQRILNARLASGQKAEEDLYKRAVQAAYDAKLGSVNDLARQWVTAYPNADSWRNSVAIYRNGSNPDVEGVVDLMRLLRANNALTRSTELSLYVDALIGQSNFIEAQSAIEQAASLPGVDAAGLQGLRATVASKPRVTAAELTSAAASAQSGMALLRIADRFYGLGDYAKAADTYRAAGAKGADANLASLRRGIALAMAGDKAGATSALTAVTGARAGIAQYWLLHLQKRS